MAIERLHQTLRHLDQKTRLSILHGPKEPELLSLHLGTLLDLQAQKLASKTSLVSRAQNVRHSFLSLRARSQQIARGLLSLGIRHGDCVGIFAGNCAEYVELFFACGRIGAILVVLNVTYTPEELKRAIVASECKVLFITARIGTRSYDSTIETLLDSTRATSIPGLQKLLLLRDDQTTKYRFLPTLRDVVSRGHEVSDTALQTAELAVSPHDVCNLQFTSGTTGNPKAAMLTHFNIINNARFIGDRMALSDKDILCCPPPLFHCFGLVLGLLATITHGSTIVFPSDSFDAESVLSAVLEEQCTAIHGVPAMWAAEMQLIGPQHDFSRLRTGIAAGSATPRQMMEDLGKKMSLKYLTNTYGMTETSPASFMTSWNDTLERRLATVGTILPHTSAKIIDGQGNIVPIGCKGELCISGYLLQKGYWKNPEKTKEVMIRDEHGTLWMHTGDEAAFDEDGYCKITGRIKDIIIRGGENIFPLEIEEILMEHPLIMNASVVGLKDDKYGEIVASFLQAASDKRPDDEEVRSWVRRRLGRHKAPKHIFWIGDPKVGDSYPLTGSGKIKKNVLRELGDALLKESLALRQS
ncbi:hypothetical protein AYO21_01753 [Fonsecaea monophora]|uniref:Acyl-CoA synthetase YngI n=1 Tax=Fonsecaea monophora TaxID=254056 RepID=A0A177FJG5_9EURO|nr:hypothetical protein AYO21_01753 [Fonsecaea monophora]KAH0836938.1 putative acyl-CoA synthetase YngI [Fonsecaea pedrosoi]OAG43901.1 hypothetical protein AYO21_01753 [Fonsecaea monophora]